MDSRRRCARLTAGILLVLAASVIACGGPSDGEVSRSDRVRVASADNGHETEEGVAEKDQDVVAYAIEITEVVSSASGPRQLDPWSRIPRVTTAAVSLR